MTSLPGPVVSADWLADHLVQVRIVDVRWYVDPSRSGRAAYESGHLPGAVWLDIDTDLADPPREGTGRHPLPSPRRFADVLGRAGIAAGTPVVAYDDAGGSIAARLWWLLHVLGEPAAVLDGGLGAWRGALVTTIAGVTPVDRPAVAWPAARFVNADEVVVTEATVLDARAADRYAGVGAPGLDPRPGHIPGARSAPWAENLGADGRLRPAADLRETYGPGPFVAYCGSGVTACHDLLALSAAGVEDTALYVGSWSQWAADPSRPVE